MINYLNKTWRAYKEKGRLADMARLRDAFRIKEKHGSLWIMHGDTAIFKVEPFTTASESVSVLEDFRGFAIEYAYGKPTQDDNKGETFDEFINKG